HVALIRSILDGDEEAAAKDAKKLMALLRGHAEVPATR
ncbi:GntR family transcriptional regulator, partial [Mesorhizobium sp. M8A.F.Ca.ET.173.01.1.1]